MSDLNKNIFITGGTGYLGSVIAFRLLNLNSVSKVFVLYRDQLKFDELMSKTLNDCNFNQHEKLIGVHGDLETGNYNLDNIDIIIHAGSVRNIKFCNENPEYTLDVNVEGTRKLVNKAIESKVKKLVFISSQSVYGNSFTNKYNENDPLNPSSIYAKSKLLAENIIQDTNGQIEFIVLRPSRLIGKSHFPNSDNFLTSVFPEVCMNQGVMVIYNNGIQKINVIDVNDIAEIISLFIDKKGSHLWNNIYNIGSDDLYSVKELSEIYLEWCKNNGTTVSRINRNSNSSMDFADVSSEKIKKSLSWKQTSIKNSLFIMLDDMRRKMCEK